MNYFAHGSSVIDKNVKIGQDSKIWHWSHISKNVKIGQKCVIGQNVFIGEGVKIGNNVKIQNNVSIFKGVKYLISPPFFAFACCSIDIYYAFNLSFSLLLSAHDMACLSNLTVR